MSKGADAVTGGGQGQHTAVQRDMAHVERYAEEVADFREESHHVAEHDAGAPGGDVVLKPVCKALHAAHADSLPKRMLRDGGGNAVIDSEVLAPSADDGSGPQD